MGLSSGFSWVLLGCLWGSLGFFGTLYGFHGGSFGVFLGLSLALLGSMGCLGASKGFLRLLLGLPFRSLRVRTDLVVSDWRSAVRRLQPMRNFHNLGDT